MQQGFSPCGQFVQEGFLSWASWALSSISCPLPTGCHPGTNDPHAPPCTTEAQVQAGRGQRWSPATLRPAPTCYF